MWVKGDRIAAITPDIPASHAHVAVTEAPLLVPGFVDTHTHGLGGRCHDIASTWAAPGETQRLLATTGTTSVLASLVFGGVPAAEMAATVAHLQSLVDKPPGDGAVLAGIHAGPLAHCMPPLPLVIR